MNWPKIVRSWPRVRKLNRPLNKTSRLKRLNKPFRKQVNKRRNQPKANRTSRR